MNALRAMIVLSCLALAACAAPASQSASAQVQPAAASTSVAPAVPKRMLRTGGPLPAERVDLSCKVDADCGAKPHCVGTVCRCVDDTCIARRDAVDPVIDPAPASSVR